MIKNGVVKRLIVCCFFVIFQFYFTLHIKAESRFDDYEMKRFNLDPDDLEYAFTIAESSKESEEFGFKRLIAYFKSGEIKVFDYTSKKLISETLPNGDIKDHIAHELLKATREPKIYEVFKENKF